MSPFGKFMMALVGWDVIDNKTDKAIPKYILWNRHGSSLNDTTMLIMRREHEEYAYHSNKGRMYVALERAIALKGIWRKGNSIKVNAE